MKLTKQEGKDLVYNDLEDWIPVAKSVCDTTRWSMRYVGIFQYLPTKKFYRTSWSEAATEMQDERPFEYEEPELIEVHQVEKVVKVWEPTENK